MVSGWQVGITNLNRLVGTLAEHRFAEDNYLETGVRILELAKRAYSLYIDQAHDEQRKLVNLMASNCTLKDGVAQVELKEVFQILADGVAKEAEMEAAGASKEAIEKEWLPGWDVHRTAAEFVAVLIA